MKEKYSRLGAFKRTLEKCCELVTFDHLYSGSKRAVGIAGETEGFVVRDIYTGIVHAYPVMDKSAGHVVLCLQSFSGGRHKIKQAHADGAREFGVAARLLNIPLGTSVPGVPHTNAIIERSNQLIDGGTTTCLVEAGLPPCYWSYAAPCFCVCLLYTSPSPRDRQKSRMPSSA